MIFKRSLADARMLADSNIKYKLWESHFEVSSMKERKPWNLTLIPQSNLARE